MAVFNSLGSNFNWRDSWQFLWKSGNKKSRAVLLEELQNQFHGQVTLTYKGRQALRLALERSGLAKGARVGINGFTCYVVYQAVEQAGYHPVLIDVAKDSLHFEVAGLASANQRDRLSAVIVQNTLGIPCDIEAIESFSNNENILLIEDLAHSLGSVYSDGRQVGKVGSLVMFSFSQDKTLDVVAGGALVDRLNSAAESRDFASTPAMAKLKLKLYPLLTHTIRSSYGLGIGRLGHKILKTLGALSSPMEDIKHFPQSMATTSMLIKRWQNLNHELAHRRQIASIYEQNLSDVIKFKSIGQPIYVRYPIKVEKAAELKKHLKSHGFYLADTWYDAPIAPAKYLAQTDYKAGQCPNAETAIRMIVNLPTHQEINQKQAIKLCREINAWQKS